MLWREVFDTLVQPDCRWAMSVSRSGRTPLPRSIRRLTGRLVVIWTVLAMLVWSVSPVLAEHGGDERDDDSKLEPAPERLIYAHPAAPYKVIVTVAPTRHAHDRRRDPGQGAR